MSIKALPSMEHVFTIKVKGTDTGQIFDGTFKYKRSNLRMKADIAKTAAILNGGVVGLDQDMRELHEIYATLKHCLIQYPEWWKASDFGYELYDLNVVLEIYKACNAFEKEWSDKVWVVEDKPAQAEPEAEKEDSEQKSEPKAKKK